MNDAGSGPSKPNVLRKRHPTTAAVVRANATRVRAKQSGDSFVRTH
jgi:hypothetical protein